MKELKTPAMRYQLKLGIKQARKLSPPSDGMLVNLIYETLRNGWHYQVEYVHDTRFDPRPYVEVYAFAPPRRFHARSADYYLKGYP